MEEKKQPGAHDLEPTVLTSECVDAIVALVKAASEWGPVPPATPAQWAAAVEVAKKSPLAKKTT